MNVLLCLHLNIHSLLSFNKGMVTLLNQWPGGRVFTNGPGDKGSIPGRVTPKTQKLYLLLP